MELTIGGHSLICFSLGPAPNGSYKVKSSLTVNDTLYLYKLIFLSKYIISTLTLIPILNTLYSIRSVKFKVGFFQQSLTGLCYLGRVIYVTSLYHGMKAPKSRQRRRVKLRNESSLVLKKIELSTPMDHKAR